MGGCSSPQGSGGADRSGGGGSGGRVSDRSVLRVAVLTVPLGLLVTAAVCAIALWRHGAAAAAAATAAAPGEQCDPEVPYYREAVILHGETLGPRLAPF
jgi:oligosaccharide translocation protein RFT1